MNSFADIYRRARDDSTMQGIDRDQQEELRVSYQNHTRDAPGGHGVKGGSSNEIYSFLTLHCSAVMTTERIAQIVHNARSVRVTTMESFAKSLEGNAGNDKRQKLQLSDFELASIMRVLEEHNLLKYAESNDFMVNGLKVHNVTALQVLTSSGGGDSRRYTKGLFTGQVVKTDVDGELYSQLVCLKSNIGTIRDIDAEVKVFKELCGASGVVEMISHGRVHHGAYLVTEWFGSNLIEFLSSSSFVSIDERVQLFTELCGAVCSLHSRNIMHGDLCPDNILVDVGEFGLSIMLCDLSNARRVGELFPYSATDGSMIYTPGYCAPEVFFGSARQCRASTKIDVFCLGLVGGMLLSRSSTLASSVGIFPQEGSQGDATIKKALRDQDIMNSLLVGNLEDTACKDVLLGMCNLTPASRGDVETAVNILQTRTSTVERNFDVNFSDLQQLFENLSNAMDKAVIALTSDFIFRVDLLETLISLSVELGRSSAWVGRKVGDPKECLRVILGLSIKIGNAASRKLSEDEAAAATSSLIECVTSISGTVEFADGHDANDIAANKLSDLRVHVDTLAESSQRAKLHMENLGRAVHSVLQSDSVLRNQEAIMKSDVVQMSRSQIDQVAEITQSIRRMEQSLAACEGINMGLVHFMRGELNSQYDKLNDVLRRTHLMPHLFLLLPKIESAGEGSDDSQLRLCATDFKVHFLCSQTYRMIPSGRDGVGYSLSLSRECLQKIAPLALVCLVLVRTALVQSQEMLTSVDLPPAMNSTTRHVQYLDLAIRLLLHPPAVEDDIVQQEIDTSSLDSAALDEEALDAIRAASLSPEVASLGYDTLRKELDGKKLKLAADPYSGLRLVLCQGKIGWVLDTDAVEATFMGLG